MAKAESGEQAIQITQSDERGLTLTSERHVLMLSFRITPNLILPEEDGEEVSASATLWHRSWGGLDAIDTADLRFVPRAEAEAWIAAQAARMIVKMS